MKTVGMILAGGRVDDLLVLTIKRPKSALPFGGIYRIIDFALSNMMHSDVDRVGVLSQYRPYSLMNHIGLGEHWDFSGRKRGVRILPPYRGEKESDWYRGTADAVYQNINYINELKPDLVLVVSGDHIYHMNYAELIDFHSSKKADLTIAFTKVGHNAAAQFGLGTIDRAGRLVEYHEKPRAPRSQWASMTVYLFRRDVLLGLLGANARDRSHEFGRDIIPKAMKAHCVYGFKFAGFWEYARTLDAYYAANMRLLGEGKSDLARWQVRTNLYERNLVADRPPGMIKDQGRVVNSVISEGCVIQGRVVNSILSPGVFVSKGSEILNSIIMHDTMVESGCMIQNTICDKDVRFGRGGVCGSGRLIPNRDFPRLLHRGLTVIGKGASIPSGARIGRNCLIYPDVTEDNFSRGTVGSGELIRVEHEKK